MSNEKASSLAFTQWFNNYLLNQKNLSGFRILTGLASNNKVVVNAYSLFFSNLRVFINV